MKSKKAAWPKELRPVVEQSATSARDHIVAAFDRWKATFLDSATAEYDIGAGTVSEIANVLEWTVHSSLLWALLPESECGNTDYLNRWRDQLRSEDSRVTFSGRGQTETNYPVFDAADIEALFDDSITEMTMSEPEIDSPHGTVRRSSGPARTRNEPHAAYMGIRRTSVGLRLVAGFLFSISCPWLVLPRLTPPANGGRIEIWPVGRTISMETSIQRLPTPGIWRQCWARGRSRSRW